MLSYLNQNSEPDITVSNNKNANLTTPTGDGVRVWECMDIATWEGAGVWYILSYYFENPSCCICIYVGYERHLE